MPNENASRPSTSAHLINPSQASPAMLRMLLLASFALVSIGAVMPHPWRGGLAVLQGLLTIAAWKTPDRETFALNLFCAVILWSQLLNPWPIWPIPLSMPLIIFCLLAGTFPALRAPWTVQRVGTFDKRTWALAALTVVGSSAALIAWFTLLDPDVTDIKKQVEPWPKAILPLAGLVFAVGNAIIEEIIWRGLLWRLLERARLGPWLIVILQAASFGLAHMHGFPRGWFGVVMAGLYGFFLGWIRLRTGGLGPPILTHVFADLTIFAILVLAIAE